MIVDMWYGNKIEECDSVDVFFYPNDGRYRGNIYLKGKAIGDFTSVDSTEIEKTFKGKFNWID
jgi:hypothetical protein